MVRLGVLGVALAMGLAWASSLPSVAILPFRVLRSSSDLEQLSSLLPAGLLAVLQQNGFSQVALEAYPPGASDLSSAASFLLHQGLQEVLGGSLTTLSGDLIVRAERYALVGGVPKLVESVVITTGSPSQVERLARRILARLFPHLLASLSSTTLAQVALQPGALFLPVGGSALLRAIALDSSGQLVQGARYLYESSNPLVATVDPQGQVFARSPGQATITVQAVGVPVSGSATATAQVTVQPPYLGLRLGSGLEYTQGVPSTTFRFGILLTPSLSPNSSVSLPSVGTTSDPLSTIGSFFASLLQGGPFTLELDLSPAETEVVLETFFWDGNSYLGTGLAYFPTSTNGSAFGVRLGVGNNLIAPGRASVPLEAYADLLFPGGQNPTVQFGLETGLNLFQ